MCFLAQLACSGMEVHSSSASVPLQVSRFSVSLARVQACASRGTSPLLDGCFALFASRTALALWREMRAHPKELAADGLQRLVALPLPFPIWAAASEARGVIATTEDEHFWLASTLKLFETRRAFCGPCNCGKYTNDNSPEDSSSVEKSACQLNSSKTLRTTQEDYCTATARL